MGDVDRLLGLRSLLSKTIADHLKKENVDSGFRFGPDPYAELNFEIGEHSYSVQIRERPAS